MTQIYCELIDCENNEDNLCLAAAIRLNHNDGCLTYKAIVSSKKKEHNNKGDKLLWDKEFFEDDPQDDESAL